MLHCHGRYKDDTRLVVCPHFRFCKLYSKDKNAKYFDVLPLNDSGTCHKFIKKPHIISKAVNLNDEISPNRKIKSKPSKTYHQGQLFNT